MFTGIIEATGKIQAITPVGGDVRLTLSTGKLDMTDVALGDSIATNGVCLTVVEFSQNQFVADLSTETLRRSGFAEAKVGQVVNLEKAMLASTRFGGHIVSGHVDGLGEVLSIGEKGRAWEIWVKAPDALAKYIAQKGSITVDGVSLTINQVDGAKFMLTLVPHTMQETNIGTYRQGSKVNLEVDVIARYLERLMLGDKAADSGKEIDMAFLAQHGYLK
ncbi:riboflavin synthase [Lacimicrobium alkaliphilum]|uniref:Riboflavin synthase n=1 Tax=Lacimicrobium alkaliphilum TaxID=1526571 RepID=A0ABQ1R3P9_9ALTE|nr:riboflavin synthase [Lacimicrobium alkaliphilum]GGD57154.1 riboflavin synthase subunit alpha [Lacimicrobium alkaliphilum]